MSNRIVHFPSLDVRSVIYLLDPSAWSSTAPFHLPAAARDPEPGHLMQGSHSLQALGQGGLPKPGKDLTGQVGSENVDTGTVFDQGDGRAGKQMIGCLVSSSLGAWYLAFWGVLA